MKKIISIFICSLIIVLSGGIMGFASGNNKDSIIYESICFDYCVATNLSEREANDIFVQISTNYDSSITEVIEELYPQLDSENKLEDTILYLQDNYGEITSNLSGEYRNMLDSYFLHISIQYYNENYNEFVQKTSNLVSDFDAPPIQPEDSFIEGTVIDDIPVTQSNDVAKVTIFADPSTNTYKGSSGLSIDIGIHAWIVVENIANRAITVGNMVISQGTQIAVGTWGNQSEHVGLWYNLEPYMVKYDGAYSGRVSKTCTIDSGGLNTLNNYIDSHDSWSYSNNCSSFASGAWNKVSDNKLSAGIINTPKTLGGNIKATGSYSTNASMRYFYRVHYAQGTGTPVQSTVYTRTD